MNNHRLGMMEARFADIIWDSAPISSGELVKICEKELEWKKSTTYTMLRRLCERGIFKNTDGVVYVSITKQEYASLQSEEFVNENFKGSLPMFLTAFTSVKKLTRDELNELQALINLQKED